MPGGELTMEEQDRLLAEAVERDEPRLRSFIRKRVFDIEDAEDVLQDVFYELTAAYRLMRPAEQMTAWLYRVARNRIVDLFRKKKTTSLNEHAGDADDGLSIEDLLPSPEAGPEAIYARNVMYDAVDEALEELPDEQRDVFVAHEFDGLSFKEISEATGVSVNTLLSRKRYAVLHLRERLKELNEEFVRQ